MRYPRESQRQLVPLAMNQQIRIFPFKTLGRLQRLEVFGLLIHRFLGTSHPRRSQRPQSDRIPLDLRRTEEAIARAVARHLTGFWKSKRRPTVIGRATLEIFE